MELLNGFRDNIKMTGKLVATLRGPDGKIKDRWEEKNLVVTVGKQHVADQLSGQLQAAMSHMAIGTGTTAQTLTDTQLEVELSRKPFDSKTQGTGGNANQIVYVTAWPAGEGTGVITEAGMFNAASGGTMFTRTVFGAKDKGAGDALTFTWTVTVN